MYKLIAVALTLIALTGCPALGVPDPTSTTNTLVVHNNSGRTVFFLSAVRVADECSTQEPDGVNLLPADLEDGGIYRITDLADGRYFCRAENRVNSNGTVIYPIEGYVTLVGATTVDWYVTEPAV